MFHFRKRKKAEPTGSISDEDNSKSQRSDSGITTATGFTATNSARSSTQQAAQTFAKPERYTGNRKLYDNGTAKKQVKAEAFSGGGEVLDPYTNDRLLLTKAEARQLYGEDWQKHLAEADHIVPIEKVFDNSKNNPWLTNDDIREIVNSKENFETVSRNINNKKRSRSNEEFVSDDEYLELKGVELSPEAKQKAIKTGERAQKAIDKASSRSTFKNMAKTGHAAGVQAAASAGVTAVTMSGIMNITAVIKGEKSVSDALADTIVDTGKAAATGYVMGGGLTVVSHTLSASDSKFLKALSKSNVPGKVITAVILTGNTLKRYGNGEITTQECIIELGEKGLNFATTGYSMAVGQALIPIPIIGAAVGALVGSMVTSKVYNALVNSIKAQELEHQERLRRIAECEQVAKQARAFRAELESYLEKYFQDYQDCFDEALSEIRLAFQAGDADGMIAGANQITRKLGGQVHYETVAEFRTFLNDDSVDEL